MIALSSALVACSAAPSFPPSSPSVLLGRTLPHVKGRALSGEFIEPTTLQRRPMVVKFFAEYCAPCTRTLPETERLCREFPNVRCLGISEDGSAIVAARVADRYQLSFPVLHDRGQLLRGRFRATELPLTVVADRDGIVRWVGGPGQRESELRQAIIAAAR